MRNMKFVSVNLYKLFLFISCAPAVGFLGLGCATKSTISFRGLAIDGNLKFENQTNEFAFLRDADRRVLVRARSGFAIAEARADAENKAAALHALLRPRQDPYFGLRKQSPTCDQPNLPPTVSDNQNGFRLGISLYATADMVYGICDAKIETQKSQILWLFCLANQTYFEVKYFQPSDADWPNSPIARCL